MKNITGKQVDAAKLNLYAFHSWSCTAKGWDLYSTGAASTSTRWTNQPSWGATHATSTQTKGYSSSCNDGWVNIDATSLVKSWASNGNGTNHLGLRASDESAPQGWKRFNSGNAASRTPYLSVTYNSIPAVPTLISHPHHLHRGRRLPGVHLRRGRPPDQGRRLAGRGRHPPCLRLRRQHQPHVPDHHDR